MEHQENNNVNNEFIQVLGQAKVCQVSKVPQGFVDGEVILGRISCEDRIRVVRDRRVMGELPVSHLAVPEETQNLSVAGYGGKFKLFLKHLCDILPGDMLEAYQPVVNDAIKTAADTMPHVHEEEIDRYIGEGCPHCSDSPSCGAADHEAQPPSAELPLATSMKLEEMHRKCEQLEKDVEYHKSRLVFAEEMFRSAWGNAASEDACKKRLESLEEELRRERQKTNELILGTKRGPVDEFDVFCIDNGFAVFQYQLCIDGHLVPCRFFICKVEWGRITSHLMGVLNKLLYAKNHHIKVAIRENDPANAAIQFCKPQDRELLIQLVAHEFLPPTVLLDRADYVSFATLDLPTTLPSETPESVKA